MYSGHSCAGGCSGLTALSAGFCHGLRMLPTSLGYLSNLVSADLQWCESLQHLPSSIGHLQKLWQLQVGNHFGLLPPSGVDVPTRSHCSPALVALHPDGDAAQVSGCSALVQLPQSLTQLTGMSPDRVQHDHVSM
jgi:hypothetical protein